MSDTPIQDEIKAGRRNSAADEATLRGIRDKALAIAADVDALGVPAPEAEPELVMFGAEVKALGDGKVGGYLVRFGGADLVGDTFTPHTEFGGVETLPVLYHHGQDAALKRRVIGRGTLRRRLSVPINIRRGDSSGGDFARI